MRVQYFLERKTHDNKFETISLGVFSGNSFFPSMAFEVFQILVNESQFIIRDENGKKFNLKTFKEVINNTYNLNPPIIPLAA